MKLVLTSNGFCTSAIVAKVVELTGKPQDDINAAIIVDGDGQYTIGSEPVRIVDGKMETE